MKGTITYIILLVVAVGIYLLTVRTQPKDINWETTLSAKDKIPFGAFIFRKELPRLFPAAKIEDSRAPIYNTVNNTPQAHALYLFAGTSFDVTPTDFDALMEFAGRGNQVFIASSYWGGSIQKRFHLDTRFLDSKEQRVSINFEDTAINKTFLSDREILYSYFGNFDSARAVILGTNTKEKSILLRFKVGKGYITFHSCPKIFSNYFLLQNDNSEYLSRVFSTLPLPVNKVYWDEYAHQPEPDKRSVLSFFLSDPSLKTAYIATVLLLLIFVFFEAKRKQRLIPIIEPVTNQTLAFVETMGLLYFDQKNNQDIAHKMAMQLLEFIQISYFMSTQELGEEFILLLAAKSGLEKDFLYSLFSRINTVQNKYQFLSDESMLRFNEQIETFYAKARR